MTISLRPLTAPDLPLLHHWLNAPHLRPFYMWSDISTDDVARKFTPRLDPTHTVRCRIAMHDGCDYGYAQWYPNLSYPDAGAMLAGFTQGVSVDYFIGAPAYLGRRLAPPMLRSVVAEIAAAMPLAERAVFISHEDRNAIAAHATRATGFSAVRKLSDKGGKAFTVYQSTQPS